MLVSLQKEKDWQNSKSMSVPLVSHLNQTKNHWNKKEAYGQRKILKTGWARPIKQTFQ